MKRVFLAAIGLMFSVAAHAGTVTWTFDIDIPTANLGNGASPKPAIYPCQSAVGYVVFDEVKRAHNVAQLIDAEIAVCGQTFTEANLFGNDNFVGTRSPANSFQTNQFGFSVAFYEQLGSSFVEFFGTAIDGQNLWQQIGSGSYTRVGEPPATNVPVPTSAALLAIGFLGLGRLRKTR